VDRASDHLLAGAVFAQQQYGQIRIGHPANDRANRLDSRALPDEFDPFGRLLGDLAVRAEQLLAVLGVFQGDGCVGSQFRQRVLVLDRETARQLVDQLERAE